MTEKGKQIYEKVCERSLTEKYRESACQSDTRKTKERGGTMQKKIEKLNAFAENDCNKCELRAACFLAEADWQKAKNDYPCFCPTNGLTHDIESKFYNRKNSEKQRIINGLLIFAYVESLIITALAVFLLFAK